MMEKIKEIEYEDDQKVGRCLAIQLKPTEAEKEELKLEKETKLTIWEYWKFKEKLDKKRAKHLEIEKEEPTIEQIGINQHN